MDSCRICMEQNINMYHIFNTENIVDKILFCTGIQVKREDGLPNQICNKCLDDLLVAHKFKTLCILAEERLKNVISDKIKNEDFVEYKEFNDLLESNCNLNSIDDDIHDVKEDFVENNEELNESIVKENSDKIDLKKSNRVRLKLNIDSLTEVVRKKRGPYNKTGLPKRIRKFKFRKLYCEPCGIKFTSKQQSDDHKRDVHKDKDSFVCEICGKVFVHRASHYTHVRSHLPPQYACEHCDYRTWHKHDLVKHVRIHTGVKMYQCEYCTASYYTSSNLTCHIRRFHQREQRFQCQLCERGFYDRTKLNRHLDSHNEVKRFECDVCHACFTRRCYWKKHLQRQHNVVVPPQRPGRQKLNRQIGELNDVIGKDDKIQGVSSLE